MTRTLTATILALTLALAACGGGSDGPDERDQLREEGATAACRTEGRTYETAILAHQAETGDTPQDLDALTDAGYLTDSPPRYWDVEDGQVVGIGDNSDGTCNGTLTPEG